MPMTFVVVTMMSIGKFLRKADAHSVFRHDVLIDSGIGGKPLGRLYNAESTRHFAGRGSHESGRKGGTCVGGRNVAVRRIQEWAEQDTG